MLAGFHPETATAHQELHAGITAGGLEYKTAEISRALDSIEEPAPRSDKPFCKLEVLYWSDLCESLHE